VPLNAEKIGSWQCSLPHRFGWIGSCLDHRMLTLQRQLVGSVCKAGRAERVPRAPYRNRIASSHDPPLIGWILAAYFGGIMGEIVI